METVSLSTTNPSRYHVQAWGGIDYLPDLDGYCDVLPSGLLRNYAVVNICMLRSVTRDQMDRLIDQAGHA